MATRIKRWVCVEDWLVQKGGTNQQLQMLFSCMEIRPDCPIVEAEFRTNGDFWFRSQDGIVDSRETLITPDGVVSVWNDLDQVWVQVGCDN